MASPLDYAKYTVAWIAPLHIEVEAALGVLDKRHDGQFEKTKRDDYDYIGGELNGHNIVIATLPVGQDYGVGAAAALVNQVKLRFPNIWFALLVGVAAGLPNLSREDPGRHRDIRLGDVLVCVPEKTETGIVHYTLVRDTGHEIARTGRQAEAPAIVRAAIGRIQLLHERPFATGNLLAKYLQAFQNAKIDRGNRKFVYPGQEKDVLFSNPADETAVPTAVARECRSEEERTQVFYGFIGSGDVLMRNPQRRDELRDRYNLIGLEMEAAGIMNALPTGVIRGVCDYGDSQKTEDWQPYAAAVAAVYAKGILCYILPAQTTAQQPEEQPPSPLSSSKSRKRLVNSLSFEHIEDRYNNIKAAHFATCKWLLQNDKYLSWLNQRQITNHHGILWLKGKPGSGKSTLMKVALSEAMRSDNNDIHISFFFNARGSMLEKDTLGMYRSLLFQLLETLPELKEVFESFSILELPRPPRYEWTISQLTAVLSRAIEMLAKRKLWIFVDALDECDESQIRDMVSFFSSLGQRSATSSKNIRIFFASRYYPRITMKKKVEIRLEDEEEHFGDIKRYVRSELIIGEDKPAGILQTAQEQVQRRAPAVLHWVSSTAKLITNRYVKNEMIVEEDTPIGTVQRIQEQIQRRASGIFLWVVLTVKLLNMAYDHGRIAGLEKRLEEIPDDLGELFERMLNRDGKNLESMRLCIQWILFAKRPLTRDELYFAILSGHSPEDAHPSESDEVTIEIMDAFILSCSKGLAELTQGQTPTVQFIHETVRDFLLKGNGMQYVHNTSVESVTGVGHDVLKNCCDNYLSSNHAALLQAIGNIDLDDLVAFRKLSRELIGAPRKGLEEIETKARKMLEELPFLKYAATQVFFHTNAAELGDVPQASFLRSFNMRPWILWMAFVGATMYRHNRSEAYFPSPDSSLLYILVELNLKSLIGAMLQSAPGIDDAGGLHGSPVLAALKLRRFEALSALLATNFRRDDAEFPTSPSDLLSVSDFEQLEKTYYHCSKLDLSVKSSREFYFRWGVEADILVLFRSRRFDLNMNVSAIMPYSPLSFAAGRGFERLVSFLLDQEDVKCDVKNEHGLSPLSKAVQEGHLGTVSLLLQNSKTNNVNSQSYVGRSALSYAAEKGHEDILKLLLHETDADVNLRDHKGRTPLFYSAQCGHEQATRLLLEEDNVDVISRDKIGHTALSYAVLQGHEVVVRQLLQTGKVEINAQDVVHGRTALSFAFEYGYESIAKLLLQVPDIDINLCDKRGQTPLTYASRSGHETMAKLLPPVDDSMP